MTAQGPWEWLNCNPHVRRTLEHLHEARRGAVALQVDVWTVAVEMSNLLTAGCTLTDLRLLVATGFVEHAEDVTQPADPGRSFRPEPRLMFGPRSCFVLTAAGADWVGQWRIPRTWGRRGRTGQRAAAGCRVERNGAGTAGGRPGAEAVPPASTEPGTRAGRVRGGRLAAAPGRPAAGGTRHRPEERLHETVRRLNDCQAPHRIRFESDGLGTGIKWGWGDREQELPRMSHSVRKKTRANYNLLGIDPLNRGKVGDNKRACPLVCFSFMFPTIFFG